MCGVFVSFSDAAVKRVQHADIYENARRLGTVGWVGFGDEYGGDC
tara:strand:- start:1204 stop:1338 length:135 start_codon:yes stop_codon:yes gene_type:complete